MDYRDKQLLFEQFRDKWGDDLLNKVFGALNLMCTYPALTWDLINNKKFNNINEFYEHQLEWISLIARFDHPMEQEFFKDHWLSIQKHNYDYFIDISSESLRLIEINFLSIKQGAWFYHVVCEDLNALFLRANDGTLDFKKFMMNYERRKLPETVRFSETLEERNDDVQE